MSHVCGIRVIYVVLIGTGSHAFFDLPQDTSGRPKVPNSVRLALRSLSSVAQGEPARGLRRLPFGEELGMAAADLPVSDTMVAFLWPWPGP